jgi:hypothetical protein
MALDIDREQNEFHLPFETLVLHQETSRLSEDVDDYQTRSRNLPQKHNKKE